MTRGDVWFTSEARRGARARGRFGRVDASPLALTAANRTDTTDDM